jgi:hypothetical protein
MLASGASFDQCVGTAHRSPTHEAVIVSDELWRVAGCDGTPIPLPVRFAEGAKATRRKRTLYFLTRLETRVELGEGGVDIGEIENHDRGAAAVAVYLGHAEMIGKLQRTAASLHLGGEGRTVEREPLPSSRKQRHVPAAGGLIVEQTELREDVGVADLETHHAAPVGHPK